ncbi:MAG: hypothetical protein WBV77_16630 [Solirubrobacteraceae bacterium]
MHVENETSAARYVALPRGPGDFGAKKWLAHSRTTARSLAALASFDDPVPNSRACTHARSGLPALLGAAFRSASPSLVVFVLSGTDPWTVVVLVAAAALGALELLDVGDDPPHALRPTHTTTSAHTPNAPRTPPEVTDLVLEPAIPTSSRYLTLSGILAARGSRCFRQGQEADANVDACMVVCR